MIRKSYLEHFGDEIKLNGDAYFIGLHLRRIFSYSVFGMSMNTAVFVAVDGSLFFVMFVLMLWLVCCLTGWLSGCLTPS